MAALTAAVLATLAVANTVKSVVDDKSAAKGAKKTASFEAAGLDQQAQDALDIGGENANRAAQSGRSLAGAQSASIAASGLDSSGSAADVVANDKKLSAIDVATIKNNAAREALGLKRQATLVRMGGRNQAAGYNNQASSSLLSGATNLYGIYKAYGVNNSSTPRATTSSGPSATSGGYAGGKASP